MHCAGALIAARLKLAGALIAAKLKIAVLKRWALASLCRIAAISGKDVSSDRIQKAEVHLQNRSGLQNLDLPNQIAVDI
jgi:hypothetical protein